MVVELLLGLNHSSAKPNPSFPLDWSVRQRRSKPVTARPKKAATRDSPTTPLSWSGATSVSCGGGAGSSGGGAVDGGPEESSCPNPPPPSSKASGKPRSKYWHVNLQVLIDSIFFFVLQLNETKEKRTTKRSRRKKTLAELKEDETVLLSERRLLKKELATLRANLDKQRATNENLKRMKLDLQSQPASKRDVSFTSDLISPAVQQKPATGLDEIGLGLPDLNLPVEAEGVHEVECGMS
nr:DNA topoisomerase 4 subunit A like [Ipomoea batatas]